MPSATASAPTPRLSLCQNKYPWAAKFQFANTPDLLVICFQCPADWLTMQMLLMQTNLKAHGTPPKFTILFSLSFLFLFFAMTDGTQEEGGNLVEILCICKAISRSVGAYCSRGITSVDILSAPLLS